jgi:quinol monooxygenase YgiN
MSFELPEPSKSEINPYSLVGEAFAKSGRADELEKLLLALVAPTLQEKGCVSYRVHRDRSEPLRFVFYEAWATKQDLEAHLQMPYIQEFLAVHMEYLENPMQVTWLEMRGSY